MIYRRHIPGKRGGTGSERFGKIRQIVVCDDCLARKAYEAPNQEDMNWFMREDEWVTSRSDGVWSNICLYCHTHPL